MSTGSQTRTRSQRVASVALPPGRWRTLWHKVQKGIVLLRLSLCLLTALTLWAMSQGWNPPRNFRPDRLPDRALVARTEFRQPDEVATQEARDRARSLAVAIYDQDPAPVVELKARLLNQVTQLVGAETFEDVDPGVWEEFSPTLAEGTPEPTLEEKTEQFDRLKATLSEPEALDKLSISLDVIFTPLEQQGIINSLPVEHDASRERIDIRLIGTTEFEVTKPVAEVLAENVLNQLQRSLTTELSGLEVADRLFAWIRPKLPETLSLNLEATRKQQDEAAAEVEEQFKIYEQGAVLAQAGEPLGEDELALLELEYQEELKQRTLVEKAKRSVSVLGMYAALFTLSGFFLLKLEPNIVLQLHRLVTLLITVLATASMMLLTVGHEWRAEVIPLLLFGMTMTVATRQEIALMLSAAMTLFGVFSVGHDLSDATVLMAAVTGAILALDSVRTRSKLLIVGFAAAIVAFATVLGVGTLSGEPFNPTLRLALIFAMWSIVAGSLMTCLLPLVERVYGVQTDLSLLELGDPAHPLLQELIRRAPGTYNHSITVASLAEAAAESIGARGLLVRVGAYFHDIGKMLKPGYFIENQSRGANRHDSLMPAMSTLVIIAHVKDGADLARQNRLPECIIDFIQQHHGTTLVEYFYRQATLRKESEEDASEVDESAFRYPGPKPQTKEAGVLMVSDAVESASRALTEPTPARIESLVEEITRKRLEDGQFDECGLTLEEVRKIGDSLIKSLTAVYHGRVKYPGQERA